MPRFCRDLGTGFEEEKEDFFFLERSLDDFRRLLELYPPQDELQTHAVLARAEEITRTLAEGAGCAVTDYRFRSACRWNLLRKPGR